jgi:hypothetical protein
VDAAEHAEMVEKQLDAMIQRRARKGQVDPDEREALWRASARRYNARREEEMRAAWASFHEEQAERLRRTLAGLVAHNKEQAAKLMDIEPKGVA